MPCEICQKKSEFESDRGVQLCDKHYTSWYQRKMANLPQAKSEKFRLKTTYYTKKQELDDTNAYREKLKAQLIKDGFLLPAS